jgi:hypothetical protein
MMEEDDTGKRLCFVGKRPWSSTVEDACIRHNLLEKSEASQADIAKYHTSLDNLSKVEAKLASAEERASAAEKALGGLADTASPATLRETQDMLNMLQEQISKLESASWALLNLGSAAFDSNTRASALAIQLKITQDLLQQKESERTLTAQESMSAEGDLVASLQRTIQEQKEKIQLLEGALSEDADAASAAAQGKTDAPAPAPGASPANEADIAKYNTLLDNLSKVEAKLAAAEERASAAERALGGSADTAPPATPRETQDVVNMLQEQISKLESASCALSNSASAAFDSNASVSVLAIQLKITQDSLQQKESELNLKTQESISAEGDLVASLQRTIQEQKEKIQLLERALSEDADAASAAAQGKTDAPAPAPGASPANEADFAKYNTLLDNLSKVEAKLAAAEERASAAERALGGLADYSESTSCAMLNAASEAIDVISRCASTLAFDISLQRTIQEQKQKIQLLKRARSEEDSLSLSLSHLLARSDVEDTIRGKGEEAYGEEVENVDANGDGIVDDEEFQAFLARNSSAGHAMRYGASLVHVTGALLHRKGESKPYSGVNGDFQRSDEICNQRAVYFNRSMPYAMWWSNNDGKLCWCVGKKDDVGTGKMAAYVESMGFGPEEAGKRPWSVYSFTSQSWEKQAGIEILSLDRTEKKELELGGGTKRSQVENRG